MSVELSHSRTYLNAAEAAAYLRLPISTLYQLTGSKRVKHFKPGRALLFLQEDLDAFVEQSAVIPISTNSMSQQSLAP